MTNKEQAEAVDPAELLHRILKLQNRLIAPFSVHLEKRFEVTVNEFRVIMLVGRLGTTASHELAEITAVSPMSISRAVTALEKQGRLVTEIDPANRRRKILRLSPAGETLYREMLPTTEKVADYLFQSLGPAEVAAFGETISALIDSLEAEDEQGRSKFLEATRPE
ncbi:MarR family winged helix-turn-helix transcriptional regulator [Novosphingobium sp. ZN18A2]|uniref:MarR family winged helix-turn-helix transcriptional regulator n=1 Tax=Novosphingobium sp. ZN18A2 TaxID=3079861 RepID=UPI0030D02380